MRTYPLLQYPLFFSLLALLALAACDSNDLSEGDPLDGRWVAEVELAPDTLWILPEWASDDSIRYEFSGSQVVTLDLLNLDGEVTADVALDGAGTVTITKYLGGAAREIITEDITQDAAEQVTATFDGSTLDFPAFSDPVLDWVFGDFEVEFTGGTGRTDYRWRLPITITYIDQEGDVTNRLDTGLGSDTELVFVLAGE